MSNILTKGYLSTDYWKYSERGLHTPFIDRNNFIIEVPTQMNPYSINYKNYWKEQKRRCIEGYWVDGKWMPGPLYFYINFCKIKLILPGAKGRTVGSPFLRDVEWEKFYVYIEARGFSGFELDDSITCLHIVKELEEAKKKGINEFNEAKELAIIPNSAYRKDGSFKSYIHPRDYLRRIHPKNYGKPLYDNNASNVIDIEARRMGKSFSMAAYATHNFLMDGVTDYDQYFIDVKEGNTPTSETLIGAIDSKYSSDLIDKIKVMLDNLTGSMTFAGKEFPQPFAKQVTGSLMPGKSLEAQYKQKLPGGWVTKGSRSKIHHRTFADNPLAGNGTGPNLVILDEIGFFDNILETLAALTDATKDGLNKFGTIYMAGTGGDMGAGKSDGARELFYNPEKYDALCFEDIWDGRGGIGFFIPYQFRLDEYRDNNGTIDLKKSNVIVEKNRDKIIKSKDRYKFEAEKQNNPISPQEAFHISNSNIFPTAELELQKGWLMSAMETDGFVQGQCGELVLDPKDAKRVIWKPDLKNKLSPCKYKMQKSEDTTGCIQIWEHPQRDINDEIPFGLYLAGNDPYDQDQSTTASLGSTFIYKTYAGIDKINNWIVAEYTARPATAAEHHENVRKLLMYYNARCLYENERNTIKFHFQQKNSLHLLTKTPTILKATEGTSVQRQYGIHMTKDIKSELETYLRDWLMEEDQDGKLNLNKIYSLPLLEELINYNDVGNFDRVIAALLTIANKMNFYKIKVDMEKQVQTDSFFKNIDKYFR